MRRFLAILSALAASIIPALAQTGMPDAIIENYDIIFDMNSLESGTCSITVRTHIMKSDGARAGDFILYTDTFNELTSFSGEISSAGKTIRKLNMQDLTKVSASSGLADDTFRYAYTPTIPTPYTIEYRYKIAYRRGIASFPTFIPVRRPETMLLSGSYRISAPAGTEIRYSSSIVPQTETSGKKTIWSWAIKDYKGFSDEPLMPDIRELVPYVYACPAKFSLGGVKGSQSNWEELGAWLYGLQKDTKTLPEPFRASLQEMTAEAQSDLEKIRIIYGHLRKTTRYVSIQLGLGGLRPSPAEAVLKTGFGDCKALSNYMQAMLDAVGIKSEYLIVETDEKDLLPGYASLGQMNHAMLCVPMASDSLWIECTNPSYPLGYRHDGIAGHEIVLVTPEGGKKVRAKGYQDSPGTSSESMTVRLDGNGSAKCEVKRELFAEDIEPYIEFESLKPDLKRKRLTSRYKCLCNNAVLTGISDNFSELTSGETPQMSVSFQMDIPAYAKVSGDRMFIPLSHSSLKVFHDKAERVNPICIDESLSIIDTVRIMIPDGFEAEHIPENVSMESELGVFVSNVSLSDGMITIEQSLVFNKGRYPKEAYQEYRSFAKSVSKTNDKKIVLVRKASGNP